MEAKLRAPVPQSREFTVYCDVDKTLVQRQFGGPFDYSSEDTLVDIRHSIPHLTGTYKVLQGNVKILKEYKHRGYSVIIWSARGSEWAKLVAEALCIEADFYLAKPTKYIDDKHAVDFMGEPLFFTEEDL